MGYSARAIQQELLLILATQHAQEKPRPPHRQKQCVRERAWKRRGQCAVFLVNLHQRTDHIAGHQRQAIAPAGEEQREHIPKSMGPSLGPERMRLHL